MQSSVTKKLERYETTTNGKPARIFAAQPCERLRVKNDGLKLS
jgi:hypothetical protein